MIKEINKLKAIELLATGNMVKVTNNKTNEHSYFIMNNDGSVIDLRSNEIYEICDFDNDINHFYQIDID